MLELVCVGRKGCLALGTMASPPQHGELVAPKLQPCTPCSHGGDQLSRPLCLLPGPCFTPSLLSGLRQAPCSLLGCGAGASSPAQGLWLPNQAPGGPEDAQVDVRGGQSHAGRESWFHQTCWIWKRRASGYLMACFEYSPWGWSQALEHVHVLINCISLSNMTHAQPEQAWRSCPFQARL